MTPALSVILPAYNAEKTIAAAINSILGQTFSDFELILIDDGSTDDTLSIMKNFNDPRIRMISDGMNKGLPARLNQGVDLARADIIARMDSDDVSFPDRFEKQMAFMGDHPDIDLLSARAIVFHTKTHHVIGMHPFHLMHKDLIRRPWNTIYMVHPTWMMQTKWIRTHRYRNLLQAQDQDLLLRALPTSRYACLPDILLGYSQGPYNYKKVTRARLFLCRAKAEIFLSRGEYKNLFLLFFMTAIKMAIDIAAEIPGLDRLFFWRMQRGGDVPQEAKKTLDILLGKRDETSQKKYFSSQTLHGRSQFSGVI